MWLKLDFGHHIALFFPKRLIVEKNVSVSNRLQKTHIIFIKAEYTAIFCFF
jgi:hypothetical protein